MPASVTIAQAIDESGWGTSQLAANDYNLFGIKGSGPAGSVTLPTQEFENGQWVTIYAQFRVYHNVSESIADHAELLATSGYYTRAMADRTVPDAFANDLTGVYATDPEYGANLIGLMRLYNLYRFDSPTASQAQAAAPSGAASHSPAAHSPAGHPSGSAVSGSQPSIPGILSALSPGLGATPTPSTSNTPATQPSGAHPSASQPSGSQASIPGILSALAPAHSGTPTPSSSHTPTAAAASIPGTGPSADRNPGPERPAVRVGAVRGTGVDPRHPVGPRAGAGRNADAERNPGASGAAVRLAAVRHPDADRSAGHRAAIGHPAVGDPAVGASVVGASVVGVAAAGVAAAGRAGVGPWHDVRARTNPRRDPYAERHSDASGHRVTGRDAWHITRGRGPWRRCDAGQWCCHATALRGAGQRGDPRQFRRAPRQRGGVRARRRCGSRHQLGDVDELRDPVELIRRPRQLRGGCTGRRH